MHTYMYMCGIHVLYSYNINGRFNEQKQHLLKQSNINKVKTSSRKNFNTKTVEQQQNFKIMQQKTRNKLKT